MIVMELEMQVNKKSGRGRGISAVVEMELWGQQLKMDSGDDDRI